MNEAPKGKIGRLPKAVQNQMNRRLENGEKGRPLFAWLNSLPEVQAVVAAEFAGKPIREQNLSDWRKHGYKSWLWRQEALDMAQEMTSTFNCQAEARPQPSTEAVAPPLTDQMAGWVTVRYLMAIRKLVEKSADGEPDLKTLREFLHDVVAVRRGDHSAIRLKMEQERLDREREKTGEEVIAHSEGPCKNEFGDYGAGILAAGETRATSLPCQRVFQERATKPSQVGRATPCAPVLAADLSGASHEAGGQESKPELAKLSLHGP
jgi:hypothetical protein